MMLRHAGKSEHAKSGTGLPRFRHATFCLVVCAQGCTTLATATAAAATTAMETQVQLDLAWTVRGRADSPGCSSRHASRAVHLSIKQPGR